MMLQIGLENGTIPKAYGIFALKQHGWRDRFPEDNPAEIAGERIVTVTGGLPADDKPKPLVPSIIVP